MKFSLDIRFRLKFDPSREFNCAGVNRKLIRDKGVAEWRKHLLDWRLNGFQLILQAMVCNGGAVDLLALSQDCLRSAEINVGRGEIVDALTIPFLVVIAYEGLDLSFQFTGQVEVMKQDPVLQCLMPPFSPLGSAGDKG